MSLALIREWEGYPLCSTRDPQTEASRWLTSVNPTLDHCWVLGLGAGFHIQALAQKYPNMIISVVDHRPELKENFEKYFPQLRTQVQIELIKSEEDLLDCKSFALFGLNQSSVHSFRPAVQRKEEMYLQFSKALRGQTLASFLVLLDIFKIDIPVSSLKGIREFQIKEIYQALGDKSDREDQQIIRVLRELVI